MTVNTRWQETDDALSVSSVHTVKTSKLNEGTYEGCTVSMSMTPTQSLSSHLPFHGNNSREHSRPEPSAR